MMFKKSLFVFLILLAWPLDASAAEIPCVWQDVERIVAVGDVHGDYDNFLSLLREAGLVNEDLGWAGGKTHLVLIGDMLDRGTQAKDVLDLLMRLEKEAEADGGVVHVLLGNHEELNITGRALDYPDYVPAEQFVSFLPENFRKAKEKEYLAGLSGEERAQAEARGLDPASDPNLRLFWQKLIRKDTKARRTYVKNFNSAYGKWLLQKNAVIRINDIIFSHAGISEKYSRMKLKDINDALRSELGVFVRYADDPYRIAGSIQPKIVYDNLSPLWYRGLATKDEAVTVKEVTGTLDRLGARAMVTGHNFFQYGGRAPVPAIESVRHYGGRVYNIDTGISRVYRGLAAALIIHNDNFTLMTLGTGERTPAGSSSEDSPAAASQRELERFLKSAAVAKISKSTLSGRTDPWRITLQEGGVSHNAVFKYIDRRRPDPLPDSYKYEIAAYQLSKHLGLGYVPPVIEREIDGVEGSLQAFVDNSISEWERRERKVQPGNEKAFRQRMDDLKVYENLVLDSCENVQDILLDQKTWHVYQVDFSEAFAPESAILPECEIERCSRRLYGKLLALEQEDIQKLLSPYLNDEEMRALDARKDLIVAAIRKFIAARGEDSVLF